MLTPEPAMSPSLPLTSSQTVGPYLAIGLTWADGEFAVDPTHADAITITGRLLDGAGEPVPDGVIETWQADPAGRFDHPDDPRGSQTPPAGFRGFGRSLTGPDGSWRITTLRPGALPGIDGRPQAPHLDVSILARGMLDRVVTRLYFPEDAHDDDPLLAGLPDDRRRTLIATGSEAGYRFDIELQGVNETVFFDV
jgi:protocatechuate 3,4-dioxygenase alpha subunit